MIDIGVNLTSSKFDGDRAAVVDRARRSGVEALVITGTNVRSSVDAAALSEEFDAYSTAGVHPHDAKDWDEGTLDRLEALSHHERVVAIGECGLDFDRNYSPPAAQRDAFERQLTLARDLRMPLFLHERSAHDAMIEILEPIRDSLREVVVHCFTGSRPQLARYLDLDLHIGITGWICDERRGSELYEIVADIPYERLMLETDAPWLLPRTLRPRPKNGRNEPAFLPEIVRTVARARGETEEVIARVTTATARRFFGLDPCQVPSRGDAESGS
ncbi:MAG: TatD family hydrolase [Planctomycetes bacterium]|nr:TatD family hydrolase [Planctomycetota bacterium]